MQTASEGPREDRPVAARVPRARRLVLLALVALGLLSVPTLVGVPFAPLSGCGRWIALGVGLELLSVAGFVLVFKLVFCARTSWRKGLPAALRGVGASTALPAGGLIGPAIGASAQSSTSGSLAQLTRSAITFVTLTNAPSVAMLAVVGLAMWAGVIDGPHNAFLTLLPGALALVILAAGWFIPLSRNSALPSCSARPAERGLRRILVTARGELRGGTRASRTLVLSGDWKLLGAIAYYVFDNAVLWAAFHAHGGAPPLGVIAMGYIVGSLGAALPIPGRIGALEGGLIGALVLYGVPAGPAAAAVLLYRGTTLSVELLLGALAWAQLPLAKLHVSHARRRTRSSRRAHRDPSRGYART